MLELLWVVFGSDIAVDAADIALVDDEVKELPHLVALSKHMMVTIKLNMTFSMTLNFHSNYIGNFGNLKSCCWRTRA